MWIASTDGFISIVQHRELPDMLMVRARVQKDLLSLFSSEQIVEILDADYRFRVLVPKKEMAAIVAQKILDLDYPNFKSKVARVPSQKDKLAAYHEIWGVMWSYGKQLNK
ncbi:hypothetical protein [Mongoliitalea daihaiensis]|uniref:hypothetical protein n=1 Tax=Mongoliitalea daihaiensis TaxID=2782006 RepID=UPI001F2C70D0|nr:hypothetical protein [Mongoliitalea daihaiensis]UJP65462.1 hypothetical protein IPZ59_02215 [Mongoliitalea daihaiensis]